MGQDRGILKPHHMKLVVLFRLMDGFWIASALYLSHRAYHPAWEARYSFASAVGIIMFYLVGETSGLYGMWRGSPLREELLRIVLSWTWTAPLLLLLAFATRTSQEYSRVVILGWFVATPVMLVAWRALVRIALQELRQRGLNTRSVAIVGANQMGTKLAQTILDTPWNGLRIQGFYDDRGGNAEDGDHALARPSRRIESIPRHLGELRGGLNELVLAARTGQIDMVYIALPLRAEPRINAMIRKLADTTASVYVVADFFVFDLLHARWTSVGEIPVVSIFETPFYGSSGWLKRVEDIVLGSIIMVVIALPMLLIAAAIKLTSRGPVLFKQCRYGLNGQPIEVLKFRSMTVCENGDTIKQATRDDPRVTRLGAFLRRTSLDELPQFVHVLTGEMSIVGPRPHAVAHNELYRAKIQGYMLRHKVKPGITGWAQVNGWRGETDTIDKMEKRIEHDLDYIRNWQLSWDLRIIAMTVFGSAKSKNAY